MDFDLLRAVWPILKEADDAAYGAQLLFDRRREFLVPLRASEAGLEAGVLDRFTVAFDALELAILICRAFADFMASLNRSFWMTSTFRSGARWH